MTEREKFEAWYLTFDYPPQYEDLKKDGDGFYSDTRTGGMWAAWQARAAQDEWISVDDELPHDLMPVLVYVNSCVMVATFYGCEFVQDTSQAELYGASPLSEIFEQPTHWKPLPEGPKE